MKTLESPRVRSRRPNQSPVERQLAEVSHHITELYSWAVASTRRDTDLNQITTTWAHITQTFTSFATLAQALADQSPSTNAWQLSELAEQYRHAAAVRHQQALEELQCQKQPLPEGLLPSIK
jgi:hypothetical protein